MPELHHRQQNMSFYTRLDKLAKKAINTIPEATYFPIAIFSMNELGPAVVAHNVDTSIFDTKKDVDTILQNLAITTYFPIQNTFLTGSGIIDIPIPNSESYRAILISLPTFAIEKLCLFIPKSVIMKLPPYRVLYPEISEALANITSLTQDAVTLMRKRILRIFTKNFKTSLKL